MPTDSDFARLEKQRGRITFDPTVNAGHILTFVGFLVSGFIAYTTLDKRVAVVETRASITDQRVSEQEARTNANLLEIKRDVKETNTTLNQIAREISRSSKP
jgi:hypothetical protein